MNIASQSMRAAGHLAALCAGAAVVSASLFGHSALAAGAGAPGHCAPAALESIDPLKVGTLVEFDERTRTTADAIASLIAPTGYRLTARTVDAQAAARVLRRPVLPVARKAGETSIESALLLLIGEDHRLVVDRKHRLIAIEPVASR
jgi:hypothetical protein